MRPRQRSRPNRRNVRRRAVSRWTSRSRSIASRPVPPGSLRAASIRSDRSACDSVEALARWPRSARRPAAISAGSALWGWPARSNALVVRGSTTSAPSPSVGGTAGDSAPSQGSCRKTPGALYVESGKGVPLPFLCRSPARFSPRQSGGPARLPFPPTAPVAQWIEQPPPKRKVAGSTPAWGTPRRSGAPNGRWEQPTPPNAKGPSVRLWPGAHVLASRAGPVGAGVSGRAWVSSWGARSRSTTWWSAPGRWAWGSPMPSSTTPTCASPSSTDAAASAATGSRPTRSCDCTSRRPSTAPRRPCSAAGSSRTDRRQGCTSAPTSRRSAPTTTTCSPTGWSARVASSSSPATTTSAIAPSSRSTPVSASRCRSTAGSSTRATSLRRSRRRRRRASRVDDGAQVIPVNDLVRVEHDPGQYVIVGSGKTATDACIWLLRERGVDPDEICWVRPRDPWMLNRALIQPDPAIYLGMVADMMRVSAGAAIARRPVPRARGRRHHAARRPVRRTHHGEGPHPRPVGARAVAHHRERRTPRAHPLRRAAAGSSSRTARSPSPTTH